MISGEPAVERRDFYEKNMQNMQKYGKWLKHWPVKNLQRYAQEIFSSMDLILQYGK